MAGVYYYVAFDDGWTVNLGTTTIRLGSIAGLTELAEMGAVGSSSIILDDVDGTLGHSSDAILGLQQFFADEALASPLRFYAGWTKARRYYRGADSLRTEVMRKIEVSLEDGNTLAGRRSIHPASDDATVKRPAETPAERIAWLLGTDYFSGVADNGLVLPASISLTANDYSGQSAADVLNDCCVGNGDNWFVYWDRSAAAWSLAVFNFTTYSGYTSTLQLTNYLALVDSTVTGGAGPTNTWAIEPDAVMTRDPGQTATELMLPFARGTEIVTSTSSTYPIVSHLAPSTSVKTSAAATAQATRILDELDDEQDRITCSSKIAAANVNDALPGQLISGSFSHFPNYPAPSFFRIAGRTVSQVEPSDQFYLVNFQLMPAVPAVAVASFAELQDPSSESSSVPQGTVAPLTWQGTGDTHASSYPSVPKYGLIDYDNSNLLPGHPGGSNAWSGLKLLGSGTVYLYLKVAGYGGLHETNSGVTISIVKHGGATLASQFVADGGTGGHIFSFNTTLTASGVSVSNGDILEVNAVMGESAEGPGITGSAWIAEKDFIFTVTGTLV
jgi:hypothetical protein